MRFPHRVPGTSLRSIAKSVGLQIRFKDRLEDQLGGGLHRPIPDSGDDYCELHSSPVRLWDGPKFVILSIRNEVNASKYSRNDV